MKKRYRRLMVAKMLHLGCNAIDSTRVLTWYEAIASGVLTEKEFKLLSQRAKTVKEMVEDVRKIANHIERKEKAYES